MATTSHVSRRALLTAVSATLAGTALAAAPIALAEVRNHSAPDPVFAALEAYRSAYGAHLAAIDATNAAKPGQEHSSALAAQMKACDADSDAWRDLIETRPTTLAGLLAFVRFLTEHSETFDVEASSGTVMRTIAEALEALSINSSDRST